MSRGATMAVRRGMVPHVACVRDIQTRRLLTASALGSLSFHFSPDLVSTHQLLDTMRKPTHTREVCSLSFTTSHAPCDRHADRAFARVVSSTDAPQCTESASISTCIAMEISSAQPCGFGVQVVPTHDYYDVFFPGRSMRTPCWLLASKYLAEPTWLSGLIQSS